MNRLKEVMLFIIANEFPLPPEWLDHPLKGNYADHRECHVGGDFLLIYRIENGQIMFVRTGRIRSCLGSLVLLIKFAH